MNTIAISFIGCLLGFVVVGLLSTFQKQKTSEDYLLAGQSVKPWLVALSAVATNSSGFMFIGLIGYTYSLGLSSLWLMAGWIFGDFIASLFVHSKLRHTTEHREVLSFSSAIATWHGEENHTFRAIAGLLTIAFLGTYAAAQLSAGSKALHVLFDWDYSTGAIIGAVMVLLYCFAGGIRASIWTNTAQSFVMIFAMAMMLVTAVMRIGGYDALVETLDKVSPTYLSLFPQGLPWGALGIFISITGWVFAGYGVIGQPHIMLSFMTMDNVSDMKRVRYYYYGWFTAFAAMTIATGLAARILLPEVASFDPELALPKLSLELLPEVLVGLVLAGLFAATMSTADSQIISCTAAVTRDLSFGRKPNYLWTKAATVIVTGLALTIALCGSESVFGLVVMAWAALASAFAPLLTLYALGVHTSEKRSIFIMLSGFAAMLAWRHYGLGDITYEALPGILAGFAAYAISATCAGCKACKKA